MKKFFLNMLSSFMGTWIALLLFGILIFTVIIGVLAAVGMKSGSTVKGDVMVLTLSGEIIETDKDPDFRLSALMSGNMKSTSLNTILSAVDNAAEDKNIKAIYIKCDGVNAGGATLNSIRKSLLKFKKSGKPIIAYGDYLAQGDYFVASVADSLFLNPAGSLSLHGLGGTTLYFKNLLDKIGVNVQVVKVGTFKSAVEPYSMTEMSAPARAQLDTLYGTMWNVIREDIAKSRKLKSSEIDKLINNDYIFTLSAEEITAKKLVTGLAYEREMDDKIGEIIDEDGDDLEFVDAADYGKANSVFSNSASDRIAVLYATGEIQETGMPGTIDCSKLVPIINDLADDDDCKGLVLRVNSPGGSVFGSEQIWEALGYFKSTGKPLAVSMGDVAASGGYYISCNADRIFASPLTITGSIGIFGLIPEASGLLQKIGLSPQYVYTNPEGDFPDLTRPMTAGQAAAMQKAIERGYQEFVTRCAQGRRMKIETIKSIAEGRVWSAESALKIGLVDQIGELQDAIDWVAEKAKINNFGVDLYPDKESGFMQMLEQLQSQSLYKALSENLGDDYSPLMIMKIINLLRCNRQQAIYPYSLPTL